LKGKPPSKSRVPEYTNARAEALATGSKKHEKGSQILLDGRILENMNWKANCVMQVPSSIVTELKLNEPEQLTHAQQKVIKTTEQQPRHTALDTKIRSS
jgi:uncharacterized protein YmfQ (DUF2313 family)